jgi:secreted Zn-dependent insulinase-like peptidase
LVLGLSSGVSGRLYNSLNEFSLTVLLTEKGEQELERVIEIVFMAINKFRIEAEKGCLSDYIYEELRQKKRIDFDNLTKPSALNSAISLAMKMNRIKRDTLTESQEIEDINWIGHDFQFFNKDAFIECLKLLTPQNMFASFRSKSLESLK